MSKTSNVGDLMARLQQKIEQDRIEIEALTQSELKKLAENLRQSVQDESYITVRDIKEHTRWMNAVLWGAWGWSVVGGVCLFLGICVGSWGLTRWYSNNIQSLIQRRAALTRQVEREQTRLDQLRAQTWACGSTRRRTGRGPWYFPKGRLSAKIGPGKCKDSLRFCYRAK